MRKSFDFYAYNSPTDGNYYINGIKYSYGEDFRSIKRYKEYKNAGFNVLLLQGDNSYSGEDFETSACNKCMTLAVKAGIKKIIVSDTRLKQLCEEKVLYGDEGKFRTEQDFFEYIKQCVKPYKDKKGFFGLQLRDEPQWFHLKSYGQVVKALKKIEPKIYLQCNLLPLAGREWLAEESNDDFEAYDKYLEDFIKYSETDNLTFDEYPFRREYMLGGYTLRTYQAVANKCKKYNLEMRSVLQSFSFINDKNLIHRRVTRQDMIWQTNMAMGFGVREFSFFTYLTKPNFVVGGHNDCIDGACFINLDGTRTQLYQYTRSIIKRMKKFSKVLLKYTYKNCFLAFEKGKTYSDFSWTEFAEVNIDSPLPVEIEYGVCLITEFKGDNGSLFMVQNFGNIKEEIDGKAPARFLIKVGAGVKRVYLNGKKRRIQIRNGVIETQLKSGDALYIEK
jgi:hypothetical protein